MRKCESGYLITWCMVILVSQVFASPVAPEQSPSPPPVTHPTTANTNSSGTLASGSCNMPQGMEFPYPNAADSSFQTHQRSKVTPSCTGAERAILEVQWQYGGYETDFAGDYFGRFLTAVNECFYNPIDGVCEINQFMVLEKVHGYARGLTKVAIVRYSRNEPGLRQTVQCFGGDKRPLICKPNRELSSIRQAGPYRGLLFCYCLPSDGFAMYEDWCFQYEDLPDRDKPAFWSYDTFSSRRTGIGTLTFKIHCKCGMINGYTGTGDKKRFHCILDPHQARLTAVPNPIPTPLRITEHEFVVACKEECDGDAKCGLMVYNYETFQCFLIPSSQYSSEVYQLHQNSPSANFDGVAAAYSDHLVAALSQ